MTPRLEQFFSAMSIERVLWAYKKTGLRASCDGWTDLDEDDRECACAAAAVACATGLPWEELYEAEAKDNAPSVGALSAKEVRRESLQLIARALDVSAELLLDFAQGFDYDEFYESPQVKGKPVLVEEARAAWVHGLKVRSSLEKAGLIVPAEQPTP